MSIVDAAIFPRRRDGQPTMYHATDLQYNKQGELWFVTRRHWEAGDAYCEQQVIDQILEVRGSGRARYVARERDPAAFDWIVPGTAVWSDYDGDTIYGDYTAEWVEVQPDVWELEVEDRTAYLPGIGQMDNATGEVMYTHGDQVGSLRAVTTCTVGAGNCVPGETASVLQRPVYTAFGELVYDLAPLDTFIRYRYAGDWGYEGRLGSETNGGSDLALGLPYTHVGHRWYDPSTGRFLQRDPIGIEGNWNTYEYVGSEPEACIDPLGLNPWDGDPATDAGARVAGTRSGQQAGRVATWRGGRRETNGTTDQAACVALGVKITPAESPVWQNLEPCRGPVRRSDTGRKTRYYEWDYKHGHIEVYDHKRKHKGAIDAITGDWIEGPVRGRELTH